MLVVPIIYSKTIMKKEMITKKVKKVAMKELVTSLMVFNLSRMERGTDPENT